MLKDNLKFTLLFTFTLIFLFSFVSAECVDSDGGQNYDVKGTVTYGNLTNTDRCGSFDNNPSDNPNDLNEFFCRSDGEPVEEVFKCPYGCSDGACNSQETNNSQCTDTDGGINYNIKGITKGSYGNGQKFDLEEICENNEVHEYYCNSNINDVTKPNYEWINYKCLNGCSDGACLQGINTTPAECKTDKDCPIACTMCGSPTSSNYQECAKNSCIVKKCINGTCIQSEPITDSVKCVFRGDKEIINKPQRCYLAGEENKYSCETKYYENNSQSVCVIENVEGQKGDNITWKSSCGGYAYTTMDGNNDYAEFKCTSGQVIEEEISKNGFKKAYWECYDGTEDKVSSDKCMPSAYWQSRAKKYCATSCYEDKSKCGVNSFSISDECYLGDEEVEKVCETFDAGSSFEFDFAGIDYSIITSDIATEQMVIGITINGERSEDLFEGDSYKYSNGLKIMVDKFSKNNIGHWTKVKACFNKDASFDEEIEEESEGEIDTEISESLICKNSCPLDDKCFPFGYRKKGSFCSDEGNFIEQLKGKDVCDNNFECSSNVCVSGECVSEGFIKKVMNWFKNIFG